MRRKYSLPKVGMLAIVVALAISVTAFFIYTYAAPSSPNWTITGKSWVTKQFNPADTTNFGSNWTVAPGRLKNVKPGDTVDWWHSLFVSGGATDNVVTGVQQDVFDLSSNQPMDNDVSLNDRGAWHNEDPRWFNVMTDWKDYAWKRMNNPEGVDYHTTSMEALNGKSRLEDVRGPLGKNKFMFTRVIKREDMGKRICQRIYWDRRNSLVSKGWVYSSYACVEVPYDYNVEPSVSVNSDYIDAENVTKIEGINAGLNNKGTSKTQNSSYALARFVVRGAEVSGLTGKSDVVSLPGGTADSDWPCAIVRLIKGQYRDSLNIDSGACRKIVQNTGNQLNTGQTPVATNQVDNLDRVKLSANDSLCYVVMVSNYNGSAPSTDFKYAVKCIRSSKRPKVQVWGGDIKTDKEVITSRTSNNVNVPDENLSRIELDKTSIRAKGLWGTGLDRHGNKLGGEVSFSPGEYGYKGGNMDDKHWSIVCAEDQYGGNGNQRAYKKSTGKPDYLPSCHGDATNLKDDYQARTIVTTQWRAPGGGDVLQDGYITCKPDSMYYDIVGDASLVYNPDFCKRGVWRTSDSAKWIGINSFGRHTHSNSRPDPAFLNCNNNLRPIVELIPCLDMYVFRLKGINLGGLKDAKSLEIGFSGAVDNLVKVKINGYEMKTLGNDNGSRPEGVQYFGWGLPGYAGNSRFTAETQPGTVLYENNNFIDIYIKSNPSHMGLLIEDITLAYKMAYTNQNVYGSWGEYGIIANGKADSASGAGLSSSFNGRSGVTPRDYNKLTFANIPKYGNFSSTSSVPDNFTLPSVGGTRGNISGNVDVNSLASGEYNAGNITLTGSKLSVGKSIVIKSSGVVRISGDLLYTDTNDVRQLPQLIIYAKNIIIEPSVGEVNAWLITQKDGYVSTCGVVISDVAWLSGVSDVSCGKQLKINGPIKTGRLFLRRTYGGKHASSAKNDPNMHPGTPAEIINLRADTYIWAYNNYRNTGAISTMNVRELPPRY
ncbi:hypothetical protein LRM48_000480 [Candidatus Nanosynbacter sp. TM7-008]|uniref:hypothetical protein n=1 Tax=Candidatus Nanosynbacter sp. TM7-008 TaxID=2902632 RepID=UPI001FB78474|nr:hypothetical protein [Candidatus Nanosynbacter sp. TM7-008]MCJ1963778.1 hypothetical protein [Candidatus Nanosynbacter sp. TM7-008]